MSQDEQAEIDLMNALSKVWGLPRPMQKRLIFKRALRAIMLALQITKAELSNEEEISSG